MNGKKLWKQTAKYKMKNLFTLKRNFIRRWTIQLLTLIEMANEFRTGKSCLAKAYFCWNIGVGYHRRVDEDSATEFYLMPFTMVTITTFFKTGVFNGGTTHEST